MKTQIKVSVRKWKLTQAELDRAVRNGALNMSGRKTTAYKIYWGTFLSISTFIYLVLLMIQWGTSNALEANYTSNNAMFVERMEEVIEKEDVTQQDIDELIELLAPEEVDESIMPTEDWDKKMIEEFNNEVLPSQFQEKNRYVDKAIEILTSFEWFRTEAYCDNLIYKNNQYVRYCPTWKERYSIWYGTKSYPWEKITYNEWVSRMRADILKRDDLKDLTCYTDNQKAAILDFYYNAWKYKKHNITWIYFVNYVKECNKEVIKWFLNPDNYQSKWLKKRRKAEYDLFTW